jgi:hypothetical protein
MCRLGTRALTPSLWHSTTIAIEFITVLTQRAAESRGFVMGVTTHHHWNDLGETKRAMLSVGTLLLNSVITWALYDGGRAY